MKRPLSYDAPRQPPSVRRRSSVARALAAKARGQRPWVRFPAAPPSFRTLCRFIVFGRGGSDCVYNWTLSYRSTDLGEPLPSRASTAAITLRFFIDPHLSRSNYPITFIISQISDWWTKGTGAYNCTIACHKLVICVSINSAIATCIAEIVYTWHCTYI